MIFLANFLKIAKIGQTYIPAKRKNPQLYGTSIFGQINLGYIIGDFFMAMAKVSELNTHRNIGLFRQHSSFNGSVLSCISLKSKYQILLLTISLSRQITNEECFSEKQRLDFKTQNAIDKKGQKITSN